MKVLIKASGVIVVPGFLDVMRLWQEGYPNVVATMDQGVSERQLERLEALEARAVKLFLDDDGSPEKTVATMKAAFICSQRFWTRIVNPRWEGYNERGQRKTDAKHYTREELSHLLNQKPITLMI